VEIRGPDARSGPGVEDGAPRSTPAEGHGEGTAPVSELRPSRTNQPMKTIAPVLEEFFSALGPVQNLVEI
jgi:hypothetical protein